MKEGKNHKFWKILIIRKKMMLIAITDNLQLKKLRKKRKNLKKKIKVLQETCRLIDYLEKLVK